MCKMFTEIMKNIAMKKILKKLFYLKKLKYLLAGQAIRYFSSQGLFSFWEFSLELYLKNLILLQKKLFT